jgi:hypothetical protein
MPNLSKRLFPVAAVLVVAAPVLYLVFEVVRRWVDVPWWDDWEFYWLVQRDRAGTLTFMDFYGQHNEHRILWPNLVMFGLASISQWDTRVQVAFSLTIAALTFSLLVLMIRRTVSGLVPVEGRPAQPGLRWWQLAATFLASLIFFAPTQFENWLWGWQIEWFMNIAGVVVAVWALSSWRTAQPWKQILIAILGATLSTFSLGGGMLVWIVCLPIFAFTRRLWRWSLLWLAAAAIEIALYYTDYQSAGGESAVHVIMDHPVDFVRYVSVYLSRMLVPQFDNIQAMGVTAGLLLLLLLSAGYVLWRHRAQFVTLVPWLCLSLVAIGAAAATATARLSFGLQQAYSSRYTTISLLLVMSALVVAVKAAQLAFTALPRPVQATPSAEKAVSAGTAPTTETAPTVKAGPSPGTWVARVVPVLGVLWAVWAFGNSHDAVMREMDMFSGHMHLAQDCVKTASSVADDCLLKLYPDRQAAWDRLEYMRSIGWVVPRSR